jgi:hypothetical protein
VWGGQLDRNVTVTGGQFRGINWGVTIGGNLIIVDPAANSQNGFWGNQGGSTNVVKGLVSYTIDSSTAYPNYQSPSLYFGGGTTVQGKFTYSDSGTGWAGHLDKGGLTVIGRQDITLRTN